MKSILMFTIFMAVALLTNAQTTAGNGSRQGGRTTTAAKKSATQIRGSGQYHGSKDTTPGSPVGTGGAGGNEMSGSQAGSASETAIQRGKENVQTGDQTGSEGSGAAKANIKKKRAVRKNRRM